MYKWVKTLAAATIFSTFICSSISAKANPMQNDQFSNENSGSIVTEIEPNNTREQGQLVTFGDEISGDLSPSDSDMYKFTIQEEGIFYLYGNADISMNYFFVSIYDDKGKIYSNESIQRKQDTIFYNEVRLEPGTYYISIWGYTATNVPYQFSLSFVPPAVDRISGTDRYETAANIAYEGWSEGTEEIVLATGYDFPDALSASPLAYYLDAPILLTYKDQLPTSVQTLIQDLRVKKVTIIGGMSVVSKNVEDFLRQNLGLTVERIAGKDRFETSAIIANALPESFEAIVVNGRNYPDALSVAPYASESGIPILLTDTHSLPSSTAEILSTMEQTMVIGGTNAVSEAVFDLLPDPLRIGGKDRYETSVFISASMSSYSSFVATGSTFADALSGSVLAAKYGQPIVLTPSTGLSSDAESHFKGRGKVVYTILGGNSAINEKVEQDLWNVIDFIVSY